jgi:serine/threonine-protein kinase
MKSLKSLRRRCRVCGDIFDDSVPECPSDGASLADLKAGLELFGPYEFLDVLGEGGMGIVYKARHKVIDKAVAIKMLRPGRLTADDIRRFQKEGKAVSRLHHPGIVEVHDLGLTPEGLPFMVMDFINGISLKDLIETHGALSLTVGMDVAHQIADAMAHAHQKGVIHRDLKSSNIMLVEAGFESYHVKIVDFGIAKIEHHELSSGHTLTTTGEIFGSPAYMSPEQARGEKVEAKTDIYSAGCIIFECLTGATPFHGGTVFDVLVRHLNESPPTLEEASLGRKFPDSVSHLVASMLEKDPAKRPADFAHVCQLLAAVQAGQFEMRELNERGSVVHRLKKLLKARVPLALLSVALLISALVLAFISFKTFAMTETKLEHGEDIDRIKQQVEAQLQKNGKSLNRGEKTSSAFTSQIILPFDLGGPLKSAQTMIELGFKNEDGIAALGDIQLSNEVLNYLSTQHRLLGLSLVNNAIDDRLFDYIKDLPLHKLVLSGTNVTDKGLVVASRMKTLDDIELTRLNTGRKGVPKTVKCLTGKGLKSLSALPHLKALRLAENCLTDEDLASLPSMKRLRELNVAANQSITARSCQYIGSLESLQTLDMHNVDMPLSAFANMKNISQIRTLIIRANEAICAGDFTDFLKKASHLEVLDLGATHITHSCVRDLGNSPELTTLGLINCKKLTKDDIEYLKKKLPGCHIDSDFDRGDGRH